ncbi:SDR family NAD(P)-dependent oxidoreductase [Brenneria corticis]|uniref:Short-chain dehydrogenase n=1 Tax=Brenneria corticis TaxID=2173106 RepID=A0A2U1TYT0_9GAMM|nr:hypothetical protein DDT56_13690 [Brenneria sp. CFCC 11842]
MLHADLSKDAHRAEWGLWKAFSEAARKHAGEESVDILIDCAGIAPLATLEATTEALFNEVLSINLASILFLTQAASPHIRESGRIINFSSALTRIAAPTRRLCRVVGAINALTLTQSLRHFCLQTLKNFKISYSQ